MSRKLTKVAALAATLMLLAVAPGVMASFSAPAGWRLTKDGYAPLGYDRVWKRGEAALSFAWNSRPIAAYTSEATVRDSFTSQNKYGGSVVIVDSVRADHHCTNVTAGWIVRYRLALPTGDSFSIIALVQNTTSSALVLDYWRPAHSTEDGAVTKSVLRYCPP